MVRQHSGSLEKNEYTVVTSYESDEPHGICLMSGDQVHVDREDGGWTFVFHLRTTIGKCTVATPMNADGLAIAYGSGYILVRAC